MTNLSLLQTPSEALVIEPKLNQSNQQPKPVTFSPENQGETPNQPSVVNLSMLKAFEVSPTFPDSIEFFSLFGFEG